jgi:hypothetical protein
MVEAYASPSMKRVALVVVVGITYVQQKMLGAIFEGYVITKYNSYDVRMSDFKYIHCDLFLYLIITLIVGSTFVTTFFPCLNVGSYIHIVNFGVTFKNKFERSDWGFVLKVGATTIIK